MEKDLIRIGKFLSLVLRHKPETIGLTLDENGWADVSELLKLSADGGVKFTREMLERVVETNDKKRYAFNEDRTRIRASQGHSVEIDLALAPQEPPELLYHGTATRFLESIRQTGLNSGSRQHVHLSLDAVTATKVGQRHGKPWILTIRAGEMHRAGIQFFCSENGVWLTEVIAVEYIDGF